MSEMRTITLLGWLFLALSGGYDHTSTIVAGPFASFNACELVRADLEQASPWIITTPCRRVN